MGEFGPAIKCHCAVPPYIIAAALLAGIKIAAVAR
jgi:hypothetical protein